MGFCRLSSIVSRAASIYLILFCSLVQAEQVAPPSTKEIIAMVQQYCGGCHTAPSPSLLPKHSWPAVIDSMVILAKNRTGQDVIPESAVKHIKAIYYGSSPKELPTLPYIDQPHPAFRFTANNIGEASTIPQILNIQAVDLGRKADHSFLVCDGERNQVILLETNTQKEPQWQETVLAEIDIPITTQVVDYNGDGLLDILVADLGAFPPNGILAGKIFLLEQQKDGSFSKTLMMHQLGRVTDMQALDLDEDGDLDLAVAVFGGGNIGEVFWMENLVEGGHKKHSLLTLSGALNITAADLNGNGRLDLVTLVAQEHESIIAFLNQGKGNFQRHNIITAGHPLFGATSMAVEDLNHDGKLDIIFTNGDAFDTQTDPKPYHGVQWLENLGNLKFAAHDIGRFYGAASTAVGDLDGDGDLDIVASSWLNYWDDPKRQSLVWFENNGQQQFKPRPISGAYRGLVPLELLDITGNGQLDIVTGSFRMDILKDFLGTETDGRKQMDIEGMKADRRGNSARLLLFTSVTSTSQ
ncbi:FG-GAP repeat domain-containing protein [Gilvimarinus polysaccharolyticus]|uniref:FG-GAP repeat domain-containing protein n=1 Tax=Gilvimarinus polysaccharolyticus TaxID=863921 RepID=UPI000673C0E2|nr:VCBS repeat-containing protein [Gilvimarinus polysaccharolyticus]